MALDNLSLSRSTLDRAAHRRGEPGLLETLLDRPGTRVLELRGDRAPVADADRAPRLVLSGPRPARADELGVFLGEQDGVPYVLLAGPADAATDGDPGWAGLREVGSLLDDTGAGLLTTAVALTNWHRLHPRCARCGEPTQPASSGWTRHCPACGAEHVPRTDAAVIMAVVGDDDRILLGRQTVWPPKRFSTLAGFVEAGESLEAAVRREVLEEAGVVVGEVTYLGSQPWPFPASLMLGFTARAVSREIVVDAVELEQAQWWSREELALDVATGELLLPPAVSIARRLIEDWYGGPIAAEDAWR